VPLDDLLGGFALLGIGVDPLEGVDPAAAAVWAALGARRIAVLPGGVPRPVGVAPGLVWVDDAGGDLAAWFRRAGARRAIVRPDRVVLGVAADADGVARATAPLARLLG
jgi:3-(3-hydroxy-phenyl)propionate hydroxylase